MMPSSRSDSATELAFSGGVVDESKKCSGCGHPEGDCGGDYIHKDDAMEYVADNYEPMEEC